MPSDEAARPGAGPEAAGASPGFRDIPVTLSVVVGRARTPVGTLLALDRDAVLALDSTIADPVAVVAGDRIVAYGQLEEAEGTDDGRLAVRITALAGSDGDG